MIKNHQTENQNIDNIFYHLEYFEDFNFDKQFDRIEMGFILEHVDDPLFILNKYKKIH
ncbi:MAG: hypothetical protein KatS3mg028_1288 [Bacteroidia bacterium]|nr:MAG: hypothetical protein KatS3mg028_1288 [Bacteroidia bacterium]